MDSLNFITKVISSAFSKITQSVRNGDRTTRQNWIKLVMTFIVPFLFSLFRFVFKDQSRESVNLYVYLLSPITDFGNILYRPSSFLFFFVQMMNYLTLE
jgi:hypothetical protein